MHWFIILLACTSPHVCDYKVVSKPLLWTQCMIQTQQAWAWYEYYHPKVDVTRSFCTDRPQKFIGRNKA